MIATNCENRLCLEKVVIWALKNEGDIPFISTNDYKRLSEHTKTLIKRYHNEKKGIK